ncbi:MAG: TonB-dependent receptor [Bacteroides sp.]|nr:TonB-dependent receptor [Bacteroides sp.]
MSVSVIPQGQIERRMEQSVLPVLTEQVPGLFVSSIGVMGYLVSNGSAGSISIRGVGGGAQMLMLIDGHPQYMGIMGHPLADSYQSLMTERLEVVRGPASVLYGSNAMGGVVNLITKQEKVDGVRTNVRAMYGSYNTLTTEASNAVRKGKFNSYAAFGYNRSDGHRENIGFEQYSGYAKVGYDFTRNWLAYADVDITNYDASNPFSIYSPRLDYDMNITRGVTSFSLQNNYDRTSGALKFYYNFGYHKIDDGYSPGGEPRDGLYRSRDKMLGITAYQNYSLFRGNQTTVGIDYQHFGGRAWNIFRSGLPESEIVRESLNEVAGYVNFQQLFWDKVSLNAGVRIDHHSVAGNEWIPQFGISWFAAENTIVKGIVSKGFRNPTLRELYMWNYNRDLKPESLWNYELSLTQSLLDRKLVFGLNLYYIKGKNSILQPAGVPTLINTGKLENYGLEADTRYRILPNLSVNGNYSYIHTKNEIEGTPKHKLYVGGDYSMDRWTFSTGIQLVKDLVKFDGIPEDNQESFTLWNARVSYRAAKWVDIFVRGENLLAQKYETNRGYPMPRATVFGGFSLNL